MNWNDRLTKWAESGEKEFPEFTNEYLNYVYYSTILSICISMLILAFMIYILSCMFLYRQRMIKEGKLYIIPDGFYGLGTFVIMIGMVCIVVGLDDIHYMIKIKTAPRVVILEKVSSLINGKK